MNNYSYKVLVENLKVLVDKGVLTEKEFIQKLKEVVSNV